MNLSWKNWFFFGESTGAQESARMSPCWVVVQHIHLCKPTSIGCQNFASFLKNSWLIMKDNPCINTWRSGWLNFDVPIAIWGWRAGECGATIFWHNIFQNIRRIQFNECKMIKVDRDFMCNILIIIQKIIEKKMNNMI